MDRLERLINLVAALKAAERPLTRGELRERVPGYPDDDDSFRRAFERDKDTLRGMGIPVSLEPVSTDSGPVDGYRIRAEEYELPDPGLAPDELAALHLANSAVHLEGDEGTAALWKLGGVGARGPEAPPYIALAGGEHLSTLFGAVGVRRRVVLRYRGEERTVDPWRLAFRNGRWYLSGHDHDRDGERQFRLDRVEGATTTGPPGAFARPARSGAGPPAPWEMGEEEAVEARLLVDADHVGWAEAFLGADRAVDRRADGSAIFALRITNRDAFRSMVLSFLDHAEVLEPPALRDDIVAWLEGLA